MISTSVKSENRLFYSTFPIELEGKILGYLKRSDLFAMMQVSTLWKTAAEQPHWWCREASILQLPGASFTQISQKIQQLFLSTKRARSLLIDSEELRGKQQSVQKGFERFGELRKLKLITSSQWKALSESYVQLYGTVWPWYVLADEYVKAKKIEKALAIVDNHLLESLQLWDWYIVEKVIAIYLENEEIEQAITVAKKYNSYSQFVFVNDDSFCKICTLARSKYKLALVEQAIDEIDTNGETVKIRHMYLLITAYEELKESQQVVRTLNKYRTFIENVVVSFFRWMEDGRRVKPIFVFLEFYIKLGRFDLAWEFAFKHRSIAEGMLLKMLHGAFLEHDTPLDYLQKVEREIEKL